MMNFDDDTPDGPFMFLEIKTAQIRKMLLGSLLLAKDAWKDALFRTPEGLSVLEIVEEAEDDFIDPSLSDPVAKLDSVLSVINRRARAVFVMLEFLSRQKGEGERSEAQQ